MLDVNLKLHGKSKEVKFSPVEYIDVYSIKAMGKMRKFFI